jgi:hypothetical protein
MSLDQGLKVSDNGATHCVNFLKDFIYHPGVIKTSVLEVGSTSKYFGFNNA